MAFLHERGTINKCEMYVCVWYVLSEDVYCKCWLYGECVFGIVRRRAKYMCVLQKWDVCLCVICVYWGCLLQVLPVLILCVGIVRVYICVYICVWYVLSEDVASEREICVMWWVAMLLTTYMCKFGILYISTDLHVTEGIYYINVLQVWDVYFCVICVEWGCVLQLLAVWRVCIWNSKKQG